MRRELFAIAAAALLQTACSAQSAYDKGEVNTPRHAETPALSITSAKLVPIVNGADIASGYFKIQNKGGEDSLIGATCEQCSDIQIRQPIGPGSNQTLEKLRTFVLPPQSVTEFRADGPQLLLFGVNPPLQEGQTISLTLQFTHSEPVTADFPVR